MFNRISQLLKWGVARFADSFGARLSRPDGTVLSVPYVLPQAAEFTTSMLVASLVAGATASQSGTTVTIEATGHGVPASKNGSRFYFPGSASIPAGWYDGLTWVSVNTLTFQRPSAVSVAPEQINGGAAFTGVFVKAVSYPIPGGAMVATAGYGPACCGQGMWATAQNTSGC